jgi:hypothetical protein
MWMEHIDLKTGKFKVVERRGVSGLSGVHSKEFAAAKRLADEHPLTAQQEHFIIKSIGGLDKHRLVPSASALRRIDPKLTEPTRLMVRQEYAIKAWFSMNFASICNILSNLDGQELYRTKLSENQEQISNEKRTISNIIEEKYPQPIVYDDVPRENTMPSVDMPMDDDENFEFPPLDDSSFWNFD